MADPDPGLDLDPPEQQINAALNNDNDPESEAQANADSQPEQDDFQRLASCNKQKSKAKDREELSIFLNMDENKIKLQELQRSKYVIYKTPKSDHENVMNIFSVSHEKKPKDGREAKECNILKLWRSLSERNCLSTNVPAELSKALENVKKEKPQASIKDFFSSQPKPSTSSNVPAPAAVVIVETNNNDTRPQSNNQPERSKQLGVFGVSIIEEQMIKSQLTIDENFLIKKETFDQIKAVKSLLVEVDKKQSWEVDKARNTVKKNALIDTLKSFESSFKELVDLCNTEKHFEEAKTLPLETCARFLQEKSEEANTLARELMLKINSEEFKKDLQDVKTFLQRRISNMEKRHEQKIDTSIEIKCCKSSSSWEDCLNEIEQREWMPTGRNGFVEIKHFLLCKDIFQHLELRGDEFIQGEFLLQCLGLPRDHKIRIFEALVNNLPIIMARSKDDKGHVIFISVSTFLSSQTLVQDLMELCDVQKGSNEESFEVVQGEVEKSDKTGRSGRTREVVKNPLILEKANQFVNSCGADATGPSAEERRRDNTGRVGFVMQDLWEFIRDTLYADNQSKCPSISTLRRTFEAPNKHRNASSYYKADLEVRTATKRNDAAGGDGKQHGHRHECFTDVRLSREFCEYFREDCVVISADNKCKIPCGGLSVVNRLNVLNKKYFPKSQMPNFPDHDIRCGSLINPEGYMILDGGYDKDADEGIEESHTNSRSRSDDNRARDGFNVFQQDDYDNNEVEPVLSEYLHEPTSPQDNDQNQTPAMDCLESQSLVQIDMHEREVTDEIIFQCDGGNDTTSDEDDEGCSSPARKRAKLVINSDSEDSENATEVMTVDNTGSDNDNNLTEPGHLEVEWPGVEPMPVFIPEHKLDRIININGVNRVAIPNTGRSYVFNKSHRKKPSTIWRHMNDLLTMAKVEDCMVKKGCQLLLVDDGADWGGRTLTTQYFLGRYFLEADLDMLKISRNAPGDSRWNPIEHLWAYINNKLCGLMLPIREEDEDVDDLEDRSIRRLNEAIQGAKYDGHKVTPIHVPCNSSQVKINGNMYENDFFTAEEDAIVHEIMEKKSYHKRRVTEEHPDIAEYLRLIYRHSQVTMHGYVFRKCLPQDGYVCEYCKAHPLRISKEMQDALPSRKSGALFYDCIPDPERPNHYQTLLKMMSEVKSLKITPDAMFPDVKRCQESNCLYSFKSQADADRHQRLAHGTNNKPNHPAGFVCKFKINGQVCGQSFDSYWFLTKHKKANGHINYRTKDD